MHTLLYISMASKDVGGAGVQAIVEVAQRNNARHGITGLLLYNGRNFMQLLEGEATELSELMSNITLDRRHSGVVRLIQRPLQRRACGGWAMQPLAMDRGVPHREDAIISALPDALAGDIRELIVGFARLN